MMTLLGAISHLSRPRCPAHWSGKRVYDDGGGGDDDGDVMMIIVGAVSHLSRPRCPAHWSGFKNVVVVMMVMWCWQFWVPSATSPGLAAPPTDLFFVVVFLIDDGGGGDDDDDDDVMTILGAISNLSLPRCLAHW